MGWRMGTPSHSAWGSVSLKCSGGGGVKGLHMLRGPSCIWPGDLTIGAEGTHSLQHWIWFVCNLPRPWECSY